MAPSHRRPIIGLLAALVLLVTACEPPGGTGDAPADGDALQVGIVTFLSGPAAEPFGRPSQRAAETLIEKINAGEAPAPYDTEGIGGRPIEAHYVDEAGGPDAQVAELRRIAPDMDLVIGYVSSGDCEAIVPVAEELEQLTVLYDCGTSTIFEEIDEDPTYVFRTAGHQVLDSVGAARYISETMDVGTIGGFNQNYAWGQDNWRTFSAAMRELNPGVKVSTAQFPELGQSDQGTEISAALRNPPDVLYSSHWGGDLETLLIQGIPRKLHEATTLVLNTADTSLPTLGSRMPAGIVVGGRGPHGRLAPQNDLKDWFVEAYSADHDARPVYPSYHMAQAIFGAKLAYEEAGAQPDDWPADSEVIKALEGLEFETPSGPIEMALGNGHQAIEPMAYGTTGEFDEELGEARLENVIEYPAGCVLPPADTDALDWIKSGFKGAPDDC